MRQTFLDALKPGKAYHIVARDFTTVSFTLTTHIFSSDLLHKARIYWEQNPGKFDGDLMGVTSIDTTNSKLHITLAPMKYSVFRYIARCIREYLPLDKQDKLFPLGVASITYITQPDGTKEFLMGIKRKDYIEGGKLEFVPQGFCDLPSNQSLTHYVQDTIVRELQEELTPKGKQLPSALTFKHITPLALVLEDYISDYALQVACELTKAPSLPLTTEEHDCIISIHETELEALLANPTALVQKKVPSLHLKSLELQSGTKSLLYSFFTKPK